jgi:large subunit ribosomal protein L30
MAQVRVTLKKSLIGQQWRARRTVASLGLNKVNSSRILPDDASTRGMIFKVKHLVEAEPVTEENAG